MTKKEYDRDILKDRLVMDLIGPFGIDEVLDARPSDMYLTGILWPVKTQMTEEENERISISGESGGEADVAGASAEEEEVPVTNINRPSTAGISFAVSSAGGAPVLDIRIEFARYLPEDPDIPEEEKKKRSEQNDLQPVWKRNPYCIRKTGVVVEDIPGGYIDLEGTGVPEGIKLHIRCAPWEEKRLVTLTLMNQSVPAKGEGRIGTERLSLFQVRMEVRPGTGTSLVARPPGKIRKDELADDEDRSTDLIYRNSFEFAVGHTCSAEWEDPESGSSPDHTPVVATTWIPSKIVKAVSPLGHEVFHNLIAKGESGPLSASWLSSVSDSDLKNGLLEIPGAYKKWIHLQEEKLPSLKPEFRDIAGKNLDIVRSIRKRMAEGAELIGSNPDLAEAFRLANRAMALQYSWDREKSKDRPLIWRPFQIGYILLAIASVADRNHPDRRTMDLLWFPTGGGKTEAYLTLIAFLSFWRRLREKTSPESGAGVAAVMRYTLRLLTTQQFIRASSMILACEAIRRGRVPGIKQNPKLGKTPFSIGLWVGGAATPNTYKDAKTSLASPSLDTASPRQLIACPSCGKPLRWVAEDRKKAIGVYCDTENCILHDTDQSLPVYTVDEIIYRECPTLLIGTIDKFAQIARKTETNALFAVTRGLPPDLIIQDELHLISGPLGTLAGLYETALDRMLTRAGSPPKVIGSTATIRKANDQVKALFNRNTCQFPYPAIDADDSGFAVRDDGAPGRLYLGVTTAGRSAKFTLQAVSASLLQSTYGGFTDDAQRDPYWSLVGYFNSLRELGGALILMQDDVNATIPLIAARHGEQRRKLGGGSIEELTSRRSQVEIREMLARVNYKAGEKGSLDIILATNMLSVGVDIPRLGLMIVNGQPKGISEYIQATSRVGRGNLPGLVVTVLNNGKARDRSHYESFVSSHSNLYRDVEATSVTPFSSRARDRALHAVLVTLIRQMVPGMLDQPGINPENTDEIQDIIAYICSRAEAIDPEEKNIRAELEELLEIWEIHNPPAYWDYRHPDRSLLIDADRAATLRATNSLDVNAWPTMNNMRSVEPAVRFELIRRVTQDNQGGVDNAQ